MYVQMPTMLCKSYKLYIEHEVYFQNENEINCINGNTQLG